MKRILCLTVMIIMTFGVLNVAAAGDADNVIVKLDGEVIDCESYGAPAMIINNRTMVPLRAIFEALGAEVEWDKETRTAFGTKGMIETEFTVDSDTYYICGVPFSLDTPPVIREDRTLVPLRAISESFGCGVEWNGKTYTVSLTSVEFEQIEEEGFVYYGEVVEGMANGYGYAQWDDGSKYVGNWENDKIHGEGTFYDAEGNKFEGEFKDGERNGNGTMYYANGDEFEGEWKYGVKHGQGTMLWASGAKYEGAWEYGVRHGKGVYYWTNGDKYEGEFKNDARHGQGTYNYTSGAKYEGEWKNGVKHGQGTAYYANGDKYEGAWSNDLKHGKGTMYYENGEKESGTWENGTYKKK